MAEPAEGSSSWSKARVRALRRYKAQTQGEFARELGVRQQTVSDWEIGAYEPRGASRTVLNLVAERAAFVYRVGPAGEDQEAEDGP
jgi:DNA-binding transcriptional regulator YiaG